MKSKKDERKKMDTNFFQLSGHGLAWFTLPLPIIGFFSCVILSLLYDFEQSTYTHCHVRNYLPSTSSAIGGFTPQRYIWRICIALHSSPRLMISIMLYNYYKTLITKTRPHLYTLVVHVTFGVHLVELFSLLLITNISSTENYFIHELSFILFMLTSITHMLLTCTIMKWGHSLRGMSAPVAKCYKYQKAFCAANMSAFLCSCYFFYRHNAYCEAGVYSLFAMTEYFFILTNIGFHGSAPIIFGQGSLFFRWKVKD